MIKLACTSRSFWRAFDDGSMAVVDFIEVCRELGLDGVDLDAGYLASFDHTYLWEIKGACLQGGLSIANIAIPSNFTLPPSELPTELDRVKTYLDAASFLNAPMVSLSPGGEGPLDDAAWERLVAYVRAAADYGESVGVMVAIRNDSPHGPLATGSDVLRLVDDVRHSHFGYAMQAGQFADPPESVVQTARLALQVTVPVGPGAPLDVAQTLELLRETGYNAFVALDLSGQADPRAAAVRAVPALRGLLLS